MITLSSTDRFIMTSTSAQSDALAFKRRLWMREPEAKLFSYVSKWPRLGLTIKEYKSFSRRRAIVAGQWIIGMGYQPYNPKKVSVPPNIR
jgi:hypothetical protein